MYINSCKKLVEVFFSFCPRSQKPKLHGYLR